MTQKQKVKGLLDVVTTEAEGIAWEMEPSLGLGLGATAEARRWAELGREVERVTSLNLDQPKEPKRGRGQPKKTRKLTNDSVRAFILYVAAHRVREVKGLRPDEPLNMPLLGLVQAAKEFFPEERTLRRPSAENKMYESVKRGREIWGIDEEWRSPFLAEGLAGGSLFNPD